MSAVESDFPVVPLMLQHGTSVLDSSQNQPLVLHRLWGPTGQTLHLPLTCCSVSSLAPCIPMFTPRFPFVGLTCAWALSLHVHPGIEFSHCGPTLHTNGLMDL